VAFCIAAAIGAIGLRPYYGIFEHDTDTPSAARDAYLTAVALIGSAGPAVSLLLLWLVRLIRRHK
jgi:hypothetical protein